VSSCLENENNRMAICKTLRHRRNTKSNIQSFESSKHMFFPFTTISNAHFPQIRIPINHKREHLEYCFNEVKKVSTRKNQNIDNHFHCRAYRCYPSGQTFFSYSSFTPSYQRSQHLLNSFCGKVMAELVPSGKALFGF
jgi:hypothetical protein